MSDPVAQLMHANLVEVFDERNAAKRQAAQRRTYVTDVRWTEAEGVSAGIDALENRCVELQTSLGGLRFEADGVVRQLPGFGFLAWRLIDAHGDAQLSGFDAAIIKDGLITDLFTVVIPPAG